MITNDMTWHDMSYHENRIIELSYLIQHNSNQIKILQIDESEAETVFLTVLKSHFTVSSERKDRKKDILFYFDSIVL